MDRKTKQALNELRKHGGAALSDREIARRCGVSASFVAGRRKKKFGGKKRKTCVVIRGGKPFIMKIHGINAGRRRPPVAEDLMALFKNLSEADQRRFLRKIGVSASKE